MLVSGRVVLETFFKDPPFSALESWTNRDPYNFFWLDQTMRMHGDFDGFPF